MKQTAVEWLVDQFSKYYAIHQLEDKIKQAMQMEEDQIENAWNERAQDEGIAFTIDPRTGCEYYNETYKQEN